VNFRSNHEKLAIGLGADRLSANRLPETRPSSSRIKLVLRAKELLITARAGVKTGLFLGVERAAKRAFRSVIAQNLILFWGQL
jgi:hypothetical protein